MAVKRLNPVPSDIDIAQAAELEPVMIWLVNMWRRI